MNDALCWEETVQIPRGQAGDYSIRIATKSSLNPTSVSTVLRTIDPKLEILNFPEVLKPGEVVEFVTRVTGLYGVGADVFWDAPSGLKPVFVAGSILDERSLRVRTVKWTFIAPATEDEISLKAYLSNFPAFVRKKQTVRVQKESK